MSLKTVLRERDALATALKALLAATIRIETLPDGCQLAHPREAPHPDEVLEAVRLSSMALHAIGEWET